MRYILLGGLLLYSSAAMGQALCGDREVILNLLAQKYGETPVAIGITNKGGLIEVLSTKDGATWTIVVSAPRGTSCVLAAGEEWRDLKGINLDPKV